MAGKRRCWKCRKFSEVKDMRYDISGRDLICPECLRVEKRSESGKEREAATATVTNTATANKFKADNSRSGSDDESSTISYQCGSCGLGFSEEKGARIRCCPYCRKGNFRVAFGDSAQSILEDSGRKEFDS